MARTGDGRPMEPAALRAGLRRWLDEHAGELVECRGPGTGNLEADHERSLLLQRELWAAGWTRAGWPEAVGGTGGSAVHRGIVYDEVWGSGYLLSENVFSLETLGEMLIRFDPDLAGRLVGAAARGEDTWCQGFSEPDAGSDLAALRCRAVETSDGWVVNGQKVWTSIAHLSNRCFLLARTGAPDSAHRGLSMFVVDMDAPGLTVWPLAAMNGRFEFAEVFFDDVVVPADRLVGSPGLGWTLAMYLLQWERGMYAWQRQALMHQRFGHLLDEIEGEGDPRALGATWVTLAALRALSRDTVRRLGAGESPGPEISVTKVLLGTAEQSLMDTARDALLPRLELDPEAQGWRAEWFFSRATSIYGGAAEIQRTIIAERCLGLPREPARGR